MFVFVNDGTWCKWSHVEDTSFLSSSLAVCPKTLKRIHPFILGIPLLGIFPKDTIKSAVKRFLCKDVHHNVTYKDENLEAI